MANETKIGSLIIDLQIKTQALEKGLETAQKKLKEIEKSNEQVKNSNSGLEMSYIAMATTAVASFMKIRNVLDESVNAYNKSKSSLVGLNSVAKSTGNTLAEVNKSIESINEYKLMNESDVNSSIKNLLTYKMTIEQTESLLKRLQDTAVDGKQAHYEYSDSIRVTTERHKNGKFSTI